MAKGSMFARASAGLNLTPGERAALRLVEGIAASAFVAGVTAAAPYLAGGTIDWQTVIHVFAAAAFTSLGLAVYKFFSAQGDAPLAASGAAPADAPAPVVPPAPAPAPQAGA